MTSFVRADCPSQIFSVITCNWTTSPSPTHSSSSNNNNNNVQLSLSSIFTKLEYSYTFWLLCFFLDIGISTWQTLFQFQVRLGRPRQRITVITREHECDSGILSWENISNQFRSILWMFSRDFKPKTEADTGLRTLNDLFDLLCKPRVYPRVEMFYKHAKHSEGKVNISPDIDGTNIQLIFLTDSNKENK